MKKINDLGFMLAETLVVTTFVAGVLIYLFIQLTTLSENYNTSYKYNTVENLYSLKNIRDYIMSDNIAIDAINNGVNDNYIDITDCNIFLHEDYCLKLFELENIESIYISKNDFDKQIFSNIETDFNNFVNKINAEGTEKYRILAKFNNSTYATIRFGE